MRPFLFSFFFFLVSFLGCSKSDFFGPQLLHGSCDISNEKIIFLSRLGEYPFGFLFLLVLLRVCNCFSWCFCEGSGDVVGVLTLLVGGVAQTFHDDRVVELKVQLVVEEVKGQRQGGTGRSRNGETSQRGCAMDGMKMVVKRLRT